MTDKEWAEYKENLRQLNHTIDLAHLKRIIMDIAEGKTQEIDLRNSPLHKRTPAEVHDMLEELGWKELEDPEDGFVTNGWQQDTWYTFYSNEWSFRIVLEYSGYYWTMSLYRKEEEDD